MLWLITPTGRACKEGMENRMKMKAVVKYDNVAGATEVREVPVPEIGPDDVLVRVGY